ncbi:MAG: DUF86 domain-containing protein [Deltaproteobacteria bacterium]|nr:DUF86 domain-containing protein [Deltaproteobacteria bacterium]
MKKDPRVYLAQIMERIERIDQYTVKGRDAFLADSLIQDAVIRNFEVIGEAAKQVPDEYRKQHPLIPWRMMTAFRGVLIHNYEGVSLSRVWDIIEKELPQLKTALSTILPPLEQLERELAGEDEPRSKSEEENHEMHHL